jgi:hypothetical protein
MECKSQTIYMHNTGLNIPFHWNWQQSRPAFHNVYIREFIFIARYKKERKVKYMIPRWTTLKDTW